MYLFIFPCYMLCNQCCLLIKDWFFALLSNWVFFIVTHALFCCIIIFHNLGFFFFSYALQSIWLIYICIDLHFIPPQILHCLSSAEFDYFVIVNFKANQVTYIYSLWSLALIPTSVCGFCCLDVKFLETLWQSH